VSQLPRQSPGFALISVLALVTLAALMTTAFLASSRLERMSSRSVGDQARLNIALDMGCDLAQNMLVERSTALHTWVNFVYQADSNGIGYPIQGNFIFNSTPASRGWQYGYLFSPTGVAFRNQVRWSATNPQFGFQVLTGGSQSAFFGAASNSLMPMINWMAANSNSATRITLLGGRTSPPVAWITNFTTVLTTNTSLWLPTHRLAYYVEDLSGFVDAERMGGVVSRSTGTNPQEIQLASLGVTDPSAFTNSRRAFLTWGLLDAFLRTNANTNAALFATGLRSLNGNLTVAGQPKINRGYDRIPPGLGYSMAESNRNSQYPKWNLNGTFTNLAGPYGNANATNVDQIAGVLLTNVPGFTNRAGGFTISANGGATNASAYTGMAYLQTLAANIIDYADTDSDPTTDGTLLTTNRIRPVYRGVDSYPFVNEINKRYLMISNNITNNGRQIVVVTTDFFEIWNPSDKTNASGSLTFLALHNQEIRLGSANTNFNNLTTNTFNNVVIPPNGFRVFACSPVTNIFFIPITNVVNFLPLTETNTSRYWTAWNGRYMDAVLGGVYRLYSTNTNSSGLVLNQPENRAHLPSFVFRNATNGTVTRNAAGDPRAAIYLSGNLEPNDYDKNSSFGGRNRRTGLTTTNQPWYEVRPSTWPDGGHDSLPGNPAGSDATLPTAVAPVVTSNIPPGRISNAGFFSNVVELGAIFDPMQWADPSLGASREGKFVHLSTNGVATNAYGGGNTLRIGRAEHPRFAWTNPVGGTNPAQPNMQQSAAALLDLFTVAQDSRIDEGGKININTAPPAVLRALAAGVVLTNDPNQVPASFSVPTQAVDAFVTGVTNFRAKYPFYSPSQLAFIGTDPGWPNTNSWPAGAVFGTTNFGTGSALVTAWNDAAAEEWFSRIYGLSKTFGRHFRIYVVAQMLSTNTNSAGEYLPRGTPARKYYQVYLRPNDNPAPDVGPLITLRAAY